MGALDFPENNFKKNSEGLYLYGLRTRPPRWVGPIDTHKSPRGGVGCLRHCPSRYSGIVIAGLWRGIAPLLKPIDSHALHLIASFIKGVNGRSIRFSF